jgi:crotonobetainyl-CoA:carnitine CoA-transferase CaiB-like acyl-CoA transferase
VTRSIETTGGDPPVRACDGLMVLDFGQGMAGAMPGMVLADNGATVIKVEPPEGDWSRGLAGFHMWNRGKRGIVLDLSLEAERRRAVDLVGRADVVIESFGPGVAERLGLEAGQLMAANPRLVHCSISGFGPAARFAALPGYEETVSAAMGRMIGLDHLSGAAANQDRAAPLFTAVPVASYGAAQLALQGILASLWQREQTGEGTRVRTSLVQGAAAFLMRQEFSRGDDDDRPVTLVTEAMQAGIELCFMTAECSDGRFLQMCARQDVHFRNWLSALSLEDLLEQPRFERAPLGMPDVAAVAEMDGRIRERMLTRSQDEWMEVFTKECDVGCDPFLTPGEFLRHPQMIENHRVIEFDDPVVGRCRQVGPLVLFSETPSSVDRPAPMLDEHAEEVWRELGSLPPLVSGRAKGPASPRGPLDGVTVVELAYYVAGPLGSALLAELGARVIKVEPLDGDPYRRTGLQSAKFLHGKESIALDLKADAGRQVLQELIGNADVFVHSFRPGVPARLGIDYATLRALNPDVVYLTAASYGSKGPQAHRAAFHSTPTALSGAGILQAGLDNPPVDDSFPDPGAGLGVATAMLLGLHARQRLGRGQELETSMLASTGYIMSPYLVHYDGSPPMRLPDRGQHGFDAMSRLYPCRSGWLYLSCVHERHWESLGTALGASSPLRDLGLSGPHFGVGHDPHVARVLGDLLATKTAAEWTAILQRHNVPAVEVADIDTEHWLIREGLVSEASHPLFGDYWRMLAKVDVGLTPSVPSAPAAAIGEHSVPILRDLGYSADAIEQLVKDGVLGTWSADI